MKTFTSHTAAISWADKAQEEAVMNDRVHGPFSFLAAGKRYTTGCELTCRAEDWSR